MSNSGPQNSSRLSRIRALFSSPRVQIATAGTIATAAHAGLGLYVSPAQSLMHGALTVGYAAGQVGAVAAAAAVVVNGVQAARNTDFSAIGATAARYATNAVNFVRGKRKATDAPAAEQAAAPAPASQAAAPASQAAAPASQAAAPASQAAAAQAAVAEEAAERVAAAQTAAATPAPVASAPAEQATAPMEVVGEKATAAAVLEKPAAPVITAAKKAAFEAARKSKAARKETDADVTSEKQATASPRP